MNSIALKNGLRAGDYDAVLARIYGPSDTVLRRQKKRWLRILGKFEQKFGPGDVSMFSIPGRSEIAGNHTDHQHGCVLACAIDLDNVVAARPSGKMELYSNGFFLDGLDAADVAFQEKRDRHSSTGLIRGVMAALQSYGYRIGNCQAWMESDVLVGSGMSSSAAFESSIGIMMSQLYNHGKIWPIDIAKAGQYAENVYFGKPSGLMDQCACTFGGLVFIDFASIDDPKVEKIDVDFSRFGYQLCLVDTRGSHADLNAEYAAIPHEMHEVAQFFGRQVVRELTEEQIRENLDALRRQCGDRAVLRAMHVVHEDQRVLQQVKNLKHGDFAAFLNLIQASGDSSFKYLQNVYPNTDVRHQALSIGLMASEDVLGDQGVARVHGGGFAGTIQAFVATEKVPAYRRRMEQVFGKGCCHVLRVDPLGACCVVA